MVYVLGTYHPTPTKDVTYKGPMLREDEIPTAEEEFIGKPVYVEHGVHDKTVIGKVGGFIRIPNGPCLTELFIDESKPAGKKAWEDIKSRKLKGLSIGMGMSRAEDYSEFGDFRAREISVVAVGAFDDTNIICYADSNTLQLSLSALQTVFRGIHNSNSVPPHTMENNTVIPPTPADVTSPAVQGGGEEKKELTTEQLEAQFEEIQRFMREKGISPDVMASAAKRDPNMASEERRELMALRQEKIARDTAHLDKLLNDPESGIVPRLKEQNFNGRRPDEYKDLILGTVEQPKYLPLVEMVASEIGNGRFYKKKYEEEQEKRKKAETDYAKLQESQTALTTQSDRKRTVTKPTENQVLGKLHELIGNSFSTPPMSRQAPPAATVIPPRMVDAVSNNSASTADPTSSRDDDDWGVSMDELYAHASKIIPWAPDAPKKQ